MTYKVRYGRYGGDYTDEFDSWDEVVRFVRVQEDHGEIFASQISDDSGLIWSSRHPLAREGRWQKVREDAPDWPPREDEDD